MSNNLESSSDKLSIDEKEKFSRRFCYRNNNVSENCNNEDMYNAGNINDTCDTPSILKNWKLKYKNRLAIGHLNINFLSSNFSQ